jgi:hypothetical protein
VHAAVLVVVGSGFRRTTFFGEPKRMIPSAARWPGLRLWSDSLPSTRDAVVPEASEIPWSPLAVTRLRAIVTSTQVCAWMPKRWTREIVLSSIVTWLEFWTWMPRSFVCWMASPRIVTQLRLLMKTPYWIFPR